MRKIRTSNNYCEFIEADSNGKVLSSRGFQFGELYFQIKNGKVTFYLNDQENPWRNDVWTINIPFEIDGVQYDTEDAASAALHNIMNDRFQEQLDELREGLAAEEARAQEAEEQLDDKIEEETSRAISAETHLQDEITELSGTVATFDGRITNVENGLSALTDTVNDEITRSTAKDAEHDAQISGLTNSLNNEIARAISAETSLHNEILAETNRAQVAESGITANLNAEISRATTRENAIDDKVDAEVARSTAKDASHDAEISGLTTSLQNEINRAVGAENSLRNDLNAEIANRASGDTLLQSNIDAEEARALAAESALTDALNAEVSRSTAKDASQDALISGLTTSLNAEISRATGAENGLRTDLNAEISARTADVDAEEARALAAESGITANLNAEIQNRINAVSGLTERVADDEAAFGAALVDLNNKINAVSGENASQNVQISGLNNSINTEISRATSVENQLRTDVTALQTSKADKVSAVASAMYNSQNKTIDFKNISGTVISSVDARDFIKDGMVDTVSIVNNNLVITFNTDAGKEDIVISLASIFDPTNYYNKSDIDNIVSGLTDDINEKADATDLASLSGDVITISGDVITISGDITTLSGDVNTISGDVITLSGEVQTISGSAITSGEVQTMIDSSISGKQDTLIAGDYITIDTANTISTSGLVTVVDNEVEPYISSGTSTFVKVMPAVDNYADCVDEINVELVDNVTGDDSYPFHARLYVLDSSNTLYTGYTSSSGGAANIDSGSCNPLPSYVDVENFEIHSGWGDGYIRYKYVAKDGYRIAYASIYIECDHDDCDDTGATLTTYSNAEIFSGGQSSYVIENVIEPELIKLNAIKQGKLTAGNNIQINGNVISATDTKYTAGNGISISWNNIISVTGGSQPVDAYTKAESDAKFATITDFNSHSGNTTMHVTSAQTSSWDAKPNVWCGDETAWSQISGSTESGTIYLVY